MPRYARLEVKGELSKDLPPGLFVIFHMTPLRCPDPMMYATGAFGPNSSMSRLLHLVITPEEEEKRLIQQMNISCTVFQPWDCDGEMVNPYESTKDRVYTSVGSGNTNRADYPLDENEHSWTVVVKDVQNIDITEITFTTKFVKIFDLTHEVSDGSYAGAPAEKLDVRICKPYEGLADWMKHHTPFDWLESDAQLQPTVAQVQSLRGDHYVDRDLFGLPTSETIKEFMRYVIYSYTSLPLHASSSAESPNYPIPVWIQSLWPNKSPYPLLCDSSYLRQAIADGCAIAATSVDEFVANPFAFPEVYAQVCMRLANSISYATDRTAKGKSTDEFSHPAAFHPVGVNGCDCEDAAAAIQDFSSRLYYAATMEQEFKVLYEFEDIVALLKLARCYIAVTHDTIAGAPSRKLAAKIYLLEHKEHNPESEADPDPWSGVREEDDLHIIVRLYPIGLLKKMFSSEQIAKVSSGQLKSNDETTAIRRFLDHHPDHPLLPVLHCETTDRCLASEDTRDNVAFALSMTGAISGMDDYRTLVDLRTFCTERFVKIILRGYSSVLFLETGVPMLIGFDKSSPKGLNIGINGTAEKVTKHMTENCAFMGCEAPTEVERSLAISHWHARPWPRTIRLAKPNAPDESHVYNLTPFAKRIPDSCTIVFALANADELPAILEKHGFYVRERSISRVTYSYTIGVFIIGKSPMSN